MAFVPASPKRSAIVISHREPVLAGMFSVLARPEALFQPTKVLQAEVV